MPAMRDFSLNKIFNIESKKRLRLAEFWQKTIIFLAKRGKTLRVAARVVSNLIHTGINIPPPPFKQHLPSTLSHRLYVHISFSFYIAVLLPLSTDAPDAP